MNIYIHTQKRCSELSIHEANVWVSLFMRCNWFEVHRPTPVARSIDSKLQNLLSMAAMYRNMSAAALDRPALEWKDSCKETCVMCICMARAFEYCFAQFQREAGVIKYNNNAGCYLYNPPNVWEFQGYRYLHSGLQLITSQFPLRRHTTCLSACIMVEYNVLTTSCQ